ncbi:hypothetical protein B0H17DRAFT_1060732 [Mycena rosella]|uniref:DUF6533 domain-containing protein n=1 Tax=Mycena rosella TaxID=1033263 RepID=A0AAD7GFZ5_MYCRO|nr:hypothetical protein B0H17DRAFT_1060732 [Mycena rosella]
MDPAELGSVVVALQNVATTRYVSAAGFVVLLYDHALTLGDEVEYIWSAPSTLAKILFLILRYMVPLFLLAQTITRSGIPVIMMSDTVCKGWTAFSTYAGWLSIMISNFLVLLRIWTMLPRGHRLIIWSIVFFIASQLASFAVTSWVVARMIPVLVFEPLVGLCTFTHKPEVVWLWVVGFIFEVVVFITVCWNTLDCPRTLGPDVADVTRILFRDGAVYFIILFVLRIANVVIAIVSPISSIFVIVLCVTVLFFSPTALYVCIPSYHSFIWSATTLTTSRLIINSRRAMGKAAQHVRPTPEEGGSKSGVQSVNETYESPSCSQSLRV